MNGATLLGVAILALIVLPDLAMAPDVVRHMNIRSMRASSEASPPPGYQYMTSHSRRA
jgi:hypothetical protein